MNALIPREPRAFQQLPQSQRKAITEYCNTVALNAAKETIERDARTILDLYIKMACCILHDAFHMTEEELICFLGNHRQFFRRQIKLVADDTQIEYLNGRMAEIFPTDGFPQEFFDNMLGEVVIAEGE